jgi:hypothetical protein
MVWWTEVKDGGGGGFDYSANLRRWLERADQRLIAQATSGRPTYYFRPSGAAWSAALMLDRRDLSRGDDSRRRGRRHRAERSAARRHHEP